MTTFRFLTNHAFVLIHVANSPRSTLREISDAVGITERAALSILRALQKEDLISRKKEGRKNHYWVNYEALLQHPLEGPYKTVVELAQALTSLARRLGDDPPLAQAPS